MADEDDDGMLRFLKTARSKSELSLALDVLIEFKGCESVGEWAAIPFAAWAKLEQFQDYLRLLTGRDVKEVDDQTAKDYLAALTSD